jgi:hypothetical protein
MLTSVVQNNDKAHRSAATFAEQNRTFQTLHIIVYVVSQILPSAFCYLITSTMQCTRSFLQYLEKISKQL